MSQALSEYLVVVKTNLDFGWFIDLDSKKVSNGGSRQPGDNAGVESL